MEATQEANNMTQNKCKEFLRYYRKIKNVAPEQKIDKRYKPYLAPNDKYYFGHCGYCAEVAYLQEVLGGD